MKALYINTTEQLKELCQRLQDCEWLAIDTEFMREKTYYPQLCLLQIGTPEITACIDPLAIEDLSPVLDLIYKPTMTKVFHAGGQDLEIFYHLRDALPAPVFDTQIAAPLLGFPEQAGYARLVEDIVGVSLKKTHTRADWSHRPLSEAQLEYAADDVVYLCQIYKVLLEKLSEKGRLDWLKDDFSQLSDITRYQNPPEKAWLRVKAARKLRSSQLATLQALAAWREQQAQKENLPRGWLIKDDVMADIARQQPGTAEELGRIRGLGERTIKRRSEVILNIINSNRKSVPDAMPGYTKMAKPSTAQEAVIDLLNAVVHFRADEHQLNPAQLVSRKQLQQIVLGESTSDLLKGWQGKLIGQELEAAMNGDLSLSVKDGALVLIDKSES